MGEIVKVGDAYRFNIRDTFTQEIRESFVGVILEILPETPYNLPGVWARVYSDVLDREFVVRVDGPGYAVGWQPVEPANYVPEIPARYLSQGSLLDA